MLNISVQTHTGNPKVDMQDITLLYDGVRAGPTREGLGRDDGDPGLVPGGKVEGLDFVAHPPGDVLYEGRMRPVEVLLGRN